MIELDLPSDRKGILRQAILDRLPDQMWCSKDPFVFSDDEEIAYSWKSFANLVKHRRRYFFLQEQSAKSTADRHESAAKLLEKIVQFSFECHLFVDLPSGSVLYRARKERTGRRLRSATDLGPPPEEKATQPNRMSPSGIVMFYGSMAPETALSEVFDRRGTYVVGEFRTLRKLNILDLSRLERVPGFFFLFPDSAEYDPRPALKFLNALREQISKPIPKDGTESIEYVPTQVVTEYLRGARLHSSVKIDGFKYPSATHPKGLSIVLFATQSDVKEIVERQPFPSLHREPTLSFMSHVRYRLDKAGRQIAESGG